MGDNSKKNVVNPSELRDVLHRAQFAFKKSLGQNFLIDAHALQAIVDAAELRPDDGAFEVGPGAGVVTRKLAERARRVVAVEKDESLRAVLSETLGEFQNVNMIYDDVLRLNLGDVWERFADCSAVSVVANLPYYITTPILFHLLDSEIPLRNVVIMVQREVADRLLASPGGKDYGALTVAVQWRAIVERVTQVPPTAFVPQPNVASTVLRLRCDAPPAVNVQDRKLFQQVVRAAFATRRKTLRNALTAQLKLNKDACDTLLQQAGIDGNRRGETLSIAEFAEITDAFAKLKASPSADA